MRNLKELAEVVKNIKLRTSDLLTIDSDKSSKINQFYDSILRNDFLTDDCASQHFYDASPSNSSYKNLKRSLKQRMLNTLFFSDFSSDFSEREKAHLYCIKNIALVKYLIYLNVRNFGIELCKKVITKAIYYEFNDIIIDAGFYLKGHYVIRMGDLENFEYYNTILKKSIKSREAENLAGEYYLRLILPYVNAKHVKGDTHEKAKEYFEELKPYRETTESPYFNYMTYYIESLIYLSAYDYEQTVEVCKSAIKYFNSKPYVYKTALLAFYHQEILCYTQLKLYPEGKELMSACAPLLRPGTYPWLINLTLYLTLALHAKEYQEAYYIYNSAVNHKKFKKSNLRMRERLQIFESYIHFLIFIEKIVPDEDDNRFNRIKMGKFLNSVPTFSKDKRGLNIPILVIQIVFMIVKKDYDSAIDRIEAIEKYCTRYVRKEDNFRSNCFIKMLLQIPISNFHKAGVQRRTMKYYTQLKSVPLKVANQAHEIEIVPYEDLWEVIMNAVEARFYRKRG